MTVLSPSADGAARAAALLRAGELVALPTETVYGLAGNAADEEAVRQIFLRKGRPLLDPLIVHVRDISHAQELSVWSEAAERLAGRFWPGPLTLLSPRRGATLPDLVTAGLPSVGLRCPAHPLFQEVLRRSGLALAAPSANPFGRLSPTRAEHVVRGLGGRVDWVLDGGPCAAGVESTIVDLTTPGAPVLRRPGPVAAAAVADCLGLAEIRPAAAGPVRAPGELPAHYQPFTPVRLFDGSPPPHPTGGTVWWRRPAQPGPHEWWLTEDGDLRAAAGGLYDLLHRLDLLGLPVLWLERPPAGGLGDALRDRLARAAEPGFR